MLNKNKEQHGKIESNILFCKIKKQESIHLENNQHPRDIIVTIVSKSNE